MAIFQLCFKASNLTKVERIQMYFWTSQGGPLSPIVVAINGVTINGRKYQGNWGNYTAYSIVITPFTTS